MSERIKITKFKEGKWKTRTRYLAQADGEVIGDYATRREAKEKAEARCQHNDDLTASMDEQLSWEFDV